MLKLKSEKVQDFILDARNEMENLWNQLYFSQKERDAFALFEAGKMERQNASPNSRLTFFSLNRYL